MKRYPVVGIAGQLGAGKDTVAQRLVEHWGFTRLGFADGLRDEVRTKLRRTLIAYWIEKEGVVPADRDAEDRVITALFHSKPPTVRALLQELGTEIRRADNPTYWVKQWLLAMDTHWDRRTVVPDVRFENEAKIVQRWGTLIHVSRPEPGICTDVHCPRHDSPGHLAHVHYDPSRAPSSHDSETDVAMWPAETFDRCFANDGTIEALWAQVDDWVRQQPWAS